MENTSTRLWTWQYTLAVSLTFLFYLSLQSLLGGFPVFVTEISHNPAYGGLMTTFFMFASVVSRPVMSMFINKINMKKCLSIAIVCIFITIMLCFINVPLPVLFFLRVIQGIEFGVITTLLATFTTNVIPDSRLGEGISFFGLATSIGTTIGPMVALSFIHSYSFKIVLVFSLTVMLIIFAGSLLVKNKQVVKTKQSEPKNSLLKNALDPKAFVPCFLVMLFYVTFTGLVNFIDGLGESVGLGGKASIFFLILLGMLVLTRPFSGRIYDRKGHKFLIYPASITCIIGLALLANAKSVSMIILAGVFYGFTYGVMQPSLQAWAVSSVDPEKKATANAMALSFMDLGQAIGAVALGIVVGKVGYSSMYGFSSILAVIMLVIYFVMNIRTKKVKKKSIAA